MGGDDELYIVTTMMLTFHIALLWLLAAFELGLMLYVFFRYQRRGSIYSLCGLLFGFVVIAVFAGLQLIDVSESTRILFGKLAYYGGCISFTSTLMLALEYPVLSAIRSQWKILFAVVPLVFFLPYILFVPNFIDHIVRTRSSLYIFPGISFSVFALFVLGYYLATSLILAQKQKRVSGTLRKQATLFALFFIVTAAFGIIDTFLLPLWGIPSNALFGAEVDAVVVTLIAFIVLRNV